MTTAEVFHLATPDTWRAAQAAGELRPASLTDEGFVHCSTPAQLAGTIERHFAGADELVLLRLDTGSLQSDLRWEESRPGERFPHVYRAIALAEVVAAIPWQRADDGTVSLPPGVG